ncbi:hypothetical protein PRIPAC_74441 [Pristionchus pacificus]|uniref:Uncharacterized protein n=1 Tax=Pristionchus pacificus TaxID=54126 RepID=A0A2A6BZZ6_PRIPA|nr:hypothetical protein PRIPAC_74441 [Pristionchus pacificus]|eukprot:PDM71341.1 hypothetical protein PRIPAC_37748 [Pristionchus pacificus]
MEPEMGPDAATDLSLHDQELPWSVLAGTLLNNYAQLYAQAEMINLLCNQPNEEHKVKSPKKSYYRSRKAFDYDIRGLRSPPATLCPYCELELPSIYMVEHHSRKEHNEERACVYGCSECNRWTATTNALIKHWERNKCPTGRLIMRNPSEATVPRSREKDCTKISWACSSCTKGFITRSGLRYHILNICTTAEAIDLNKFTEEGIQFATTETARGFRMAITNNQPVPVPPVLSSFPRVDVQNPETAQTLTDENMEAHSPTESNESNEL